MQQEQRGRSIIRRTYPLTLIIAVQTTDDKIVIGADGLLLSYSPDTDAQVAFPTNKLYSVKGTDWILAFAGESILETFYRTIEAQVELRQRPPFDPHIEIGGIAYLNALQSAVLETQRSTPGRTMRDTTVILAGFDLNKKPCVLQAIIPRGGCYLAPGALAIAGATGPSMIAHWLVVSIQKCRTSVQTLKKLIYFSIWQVSKFDTRVGRPDVGLPITTCVMEAGKPPRYESISSGEITAALGDWESGLQEYVIRTLDKIAPAQSRQAPESVP